MAFRLSNILQIFSVISLVIAILSLIRKLNENPKTNLSLMISPYRRYQQWIAAQAIHETGNYTSRLAKEQNNLFGMKCPRIRPHLGICPQNSEYLAFKTRAESIKDYMLWLDYNGFSTDYNTVDEFVNGLKTKGYFEDSYNNYLAGVRRALNRNQT